VPGGPIPAWEQPRARAAGRKIQRGYRRSQQANP